MDIVLVIPARHDSSRLPGKPLIRLRGVTMIERTWRQCVRGFDAERIYIATDDERIAAHAEGFGARVLMTSASCLTGTDRVAEAARQVPATHYINVQGDEPVFDPEDIDHIVATLRRHPDDVINGYCPITDEAAFRSPTTPKVVLRPDGRLLYMSRAAIPTGKDHGFTQAWRQVCIAAFPRAALDAFAASGRKTTLEAIEDIEMLRFLEMGMDVRMVELSGTSIAVDTPHDVERVERLLETADPLTQG